MASNRLLQSLPPDLLSRIEPDLELISLDLGQILVATGQEFEYMYFPTTCMLSAVVSFESGHSIEATVVGTEGFAGIPALFGTRTANYGIMCQIAGQSLQIPITALWRHLEDARFRDRLGSYALTTLTRVAQSTGCVAFHPIEQRLAKWLLMVQDSIERDQLALTQEFLGVMLGVARPTVTIAVRMLENAALITHRRGLITIVDRSALELASCECYAASRLKA